MKNLSSPTAEKSRSQRFVARQGAAICFRLDGDGNPLVLLITSRDTRRWVLPRGNIEAGEKSYRCAEREAFEEAGIIGKARKKASGYYTFLKDGRPYSVAVHAMGVISTTDEFAEKGQRESAWVSPDEAAFMVDEAGLKTILRHFKMGFCGALFQPSH